jgi:hypothetical protein
MPAAPPDWDFDATDDFLVADGIETVELVRQNPDASARTPEEGRGFWESPNNSTLALVGNCDRTWNLFADDFDGEPTTNPILPGDKINDYKGNGWVVVRATLDGIEDQWRLDTVKAVASEPEAS